jgi:hypothetical protein
MRPLHAFRKTMTILGIGLMVAVGLCLLPENSYQRWRLLDGTIHARTRWIFERIHFDPQPVDVVFIGPSRVGAAVDAPRLSQSLAARGLPANVVNFSLPEAGRNINLAILTELLKTKQPKLIVIGVTEKPSRFGHSAYKYLAPRSMVADPGYLANIRYLSDLAYLPYRQAKLFGGWLAPGLLGPSTTFDPSAYAGHALDTTGDIVLPDGRIKNGSKAADAKELMRGVHKLERGLTPPILPRDLADVEFGDERHYITEIASRAKARGIPVVFLFLPYHTGPATMQEEAFYRRFGPIWNAGFLSPHAELYSDYGHLTSAGADLLSDWLIKPLSGALRPNGARR